jgi:hypothetical protein
MTTEESKDHPSMGGLRIDEIIKHLVVFSRRANDEGYFDIVHAIALIFPKNLIEQLQELVNGPIWDGDIISKHDRGRLMEIGLAIRVCCKGEQGYTGATYTAHSILKKIDEIKETREDKP